jgi:glycosyltransferase involved in cell wall biosynthesis/O-antigen/teichoic acid export membrane protein
MSGRHRRIRETAARLAPLIVVAATGVISLLNYSFSLILLWLLPAREYSVVASVTALLLVFGTVAGASAPWILAREVAVSAADTRRRQRAVAFAGVVAFGQAAAAALICTIIVGSYADWKTTLISCIGTIIIFVAAAAIGYLQGIERFNVIFYLRIGEVLVKLAAGIALVKLGVGAWGPISGFAFGAFLVFFVAVYYMRRDAISTWRDRRQAWIRSAIADRRLWGSARGIIGIQAGTAIIAGLDLIIASVMLSGRPELATYQVVQVLGRIPFYIASSLAVIVFPRMVRLRGAESLTVTASLHVWVRVCGAAAVVVGTLPNPILTHIIPARYGSVFVLLPWAALIGFSIGGINLVTTYWQATGKSRDAVRSLTYMCVASAVCDVLALRGGNVLHLAYSAAAITTAGLVALLVLVKMDWSQSLRGFLRQVAIVGVPGAALLFLRGHLAIWAVVVVLGVAIPALRSLYLYGLTLGSTDHPRVLHLAFEDPYRPGSGGGSVRTFEIDKRLALNFKVTVVCARYRGSKPRVEDGVRYVHIGLPWGLKLSLMSYFIFLPWALIRYPSELVVEDFAAPFSSVAVPWLTSRPVIGVVQWLFAEQKASEYRLPFHLVERIGLSSHRNLVAVSDDLGAELQRRNPKAQVSVIQNGLPDEAFSTLERARKNILYLGRLEIAQKGVDLLLEIFASIAHDTGRILTIAGSGPDEERIRELAHSLGIADRVVFAGRIAPADRFELLASAEVVAMPSRYETFGMVAAEALAVGTPVVAFDIPCLRSILSPSSGVLVPAFDTEAFAGALVRVLDDDWLRDRLGNSGRARVDHLRWDGVAAVQRDLYSRALVWSAI